MYLSKNPFYEWEKQFHFLMMYGQTIFVDNLYFIVLGEPHEHHHLTQGNAPPSEYTSTESTLHSKCLFRVK